MKSPWISFLKKYGNHVCIMQIFLSFQRLNFNNMWCFAVGMLIYFHVFLKKFSSARVNSLWSSDAIWWQKSLLTWAQVMTAPSHYLIQCWLQVRFCGIHMKVISQWVPQVLFFIMGLKIIPLNLLPHLSGVKICNVTYFRAEGYWWEDDGTRLSWCLHHQGQKGQYSRYCRSSAAWRRGRWVEWAVIAGKNLWGSVWYHLRIKTRSTSGAYRSKTNYVSVAICIYI